MQEVFKVGNRGSVIPGENIMGFRFVLAVKGADIATHGPKARFLIQGFKYGDITRKGVLVHT